MQDNTPNNWKTLLENTDSFSGETIRGKNEVWEKLYSRLHKKPKRKLRSWYWAAACFLLVAISTVVFFVSKEKHQRGLVTVSFPVKQTATGAERPLGIQQKNEAFALSQPKQKNQIDVSYQKNKTIKTTKLITSIPTIDSITKQLPELVLSSNGVYDSLIKSIIAATPVKKKLKVVHLNEIGQPADEPTVNNRFSERPGFGSRIINSQTYNPVYGSSANNGLILTKPRNSSN